MENNNKYVKYLAIFALLLSVAGVTVGFAAFSNTVEIKATADFTPDGSAYRGGVLSVDPDEQTDGTVVPTTEGATAESANLTERGIQNIVVHFTEAGQSATYNFYGVNASEFVAYLNSVVFGTKTCTPGTGTTTSYVADACEFINLTIKIGNDEFTETNNAINGHELNSTGHETITVTVDYIAGAPSADGPFTVDFGTSVISYGTVD